MEVKSGPSHLHRMKTLKVILGFMKERDIYKEK